MQFWWVLLVGPMDVALNADAILKAAYDGGAETEPSSNQSHHINEIIESLKRLDGVWEHLVAEEQQRVLNLLVAEVRVNKKEVKIQFRDEGIDQIAAELKPIGNE